MQSAWDWLIHVLETMPAWLAAVLVGWAMSAGVTQAVKFWLPLTIRHGSREQATRLIAVLSAAIPAGIVFASLQGQAYAIVFVALGAGLWSPLAFSFLQAALRRYLPWAAEVLSQDVRKFDGGKVDTRP